MTDLDHLAQTLLSAGPHKQESTPRLVRGLLGSQFVFSSTRAQYIWEHQYYPYFYVPRADFATGVLEERSDGKEKGYVLLRLSAGDKGTERVIYFLERVLKGLVRVEHSAIDWFAEDTPLLGPHPKDPYKRIETLPSSRAITIRLPKSHTTLAHSTQNIFLYETLLRPRYYLSATSVKREYLVESETTSFCPYKGMANYYHVVVGDTKIQDAVWYYKYPTAESALVAGYLCFYNEKFDVFVDGEKEETEG